MQNATLTNLHNGAAVELFEYELKRVLENIADDNTSPTAVREIKITIKLKPSKDRSTATTELNVDSKLCPPQAHESVMFFDSDGRGNFGAFVTQLREQELDFQESKIVELKGANQ